MPKRNFKSFVVCILIVFSFIISIAFTSCHSGSKEKNIFRYNEASGIPTLDPAFAKNQSIMWAIHQVYNTLVEVDSNLHIIPSLAKKWDMSADNRTITFHLRTDVFFQDNTAFKNGTGRKFVAADVVYSFKRIMDPGTASSGAWIFNDKVDTSNAFSAPDDSTFQLKLVRPFQPIFGILSMQYCSIVAKEAVDKFGRDFRSHPCGTGPFELLAWEEGQAMILRRNKHYFEKDSMGVKLPYLDGIKISFLDSKATEFLQFQQGKLDFIMDIDPSFKDEVFTKTGLLRKEWAGKINLVKKPFLNIEYLGILEDSSNALVKKSPLKNVMVRQAINYAIDRKKMILYLRNSLGIPAESGFVPAGLPSFNAALVKGYNYDPAKAVRLLKACGYYNNSDFPKIKLLTIPIYADLGSYIANELMEVGINVQVEVVQKSLLIEQTSRSAVLFFRGSWIADYPDAENYLSVFYGKNPAPPNYTRYKNYLFDNLYEKAITEKNDTIRMKLYQLADQQVMKDAPVVPLWYDMVVRLVNPSVSNFYTNSLNILELRQVKLGK